MSAGVPAVSPPRANWRVAWVVLVGVLTLLLVGLGWGLLHPATTPTSSAIGSQAPAMTLRAFDGSTVRLSQFRGKAVVLNFWASWCVSCRQEQVPLVQASNRWQGKVQFIGVDIQDSARAARSYAASARYPYPVGMPTTDVAATYGVTAPPETFFIDSAGTVVGLYAGPLDASTIARYLELTGVRQ
ncbi:MAG TPA: TlpA disulfide reductase family protein [Candidatus Dormibacteraeota bacterium]|jgi:cytochrome c biogenesis protein CcmG/thiol:disulfide interchange protein DsbE|nr:TlpA disulfide reductase family protein [Candidatus Dormibacteraeota bacterium]